MGCSDVREKGEIGEMASATPAKSLPATTGSFAALRIVSVGKTLRIAYGVHFHFPTETK
jgi:hypothetical protein